jgi:hypothetical protein
MDWITDTVAVGNYLDAQDIDLLQREAIGSILGLVEVLEGVEPAALGVKEIRIVPLVDGVGNEVRLFRHAVATLADLLRRCPPVLVHCHAGRSRAAAVVAVHLMSALGVGAEEALALVAAKRAIAVSPALERLLGEIV